MILADQIRNYVRNALIEPARQRGQITARVKAGEVHAALGLKNRMPAVCSALDADKFLQDAGVILVSREGPKQGSSAEWVFEVSAAPVRGEDGNGRGGRPERGRICP